MDYSVNRAGRSIRYEGRTFTVREEGRGVFSIRELPEGFRVGDFVVALNDEGKPTAWIAGTGPHRGLIVDLARIAVENGLAR